MHRTLIVRWPVPVTRDDGYAYLSASYGFPVSVLADFAVQRLNKLSERCPAGGIMPEPHEGERWAFNYGGEIILDVLPEQEHLDVDLVLLDRFGEPYDPSELMRTRSVS